MPTAFQSSTTQNTVSVVITSARRKLIVPTASKPEVDQPKPASQDNGTKFKAQTLATVLRTTAAKNFAEPLSGFVKRVTTRTQQVAAKATEPVRQMSNLEYLCSQAGVYFWNNVKNVAIGCYDELRGLNLKGATNGI